MTEQELAAIEKACAEATEGPWTALWVEWRGGEVLCDGIHHGKWKHQAIVETDGGYYPPSPPDARFIAGSRQWVPALVAEVRRLALHEKRVRAAALEEAAKVAELWESDSATWLAIAKGIRALKEKP